MMRNFCSLAALCVGLLLICDGPDAYAVSLGIGLAAVDNMDDRASPATTAQVGWTETVYSQIYYWGSDFGPVSERHYVATFGAKAPITGLRFLAAHYGLVASRHDTSLYVNEASRSVVNPPEPKREIDYNLGGVLGLGIGSASGPKT